MIDQNMGVVANIQRAGAGRAGELPGSALERYRRLGDEPSACGALTNMGMAHVDLGEWAAAEACYREAAEIAEPGRARDPQVGTGGAEPGTKLHIRTPAATRRPRESCERSLALYQRLRAKQGIGGSVPVPRHALP
jgi:hypothetical protein